MRARAVLPFKSGAARPAAPVSAVDLPAFERLAADFARCLRPGDVVALHGDVGAGKTTFVAAAVRALGGDDAVSSPTFTFWHRYRGAATPLEHLDLYRVEQPSDASELGLEDAFEGSAIVFVEWPERLPHLIPSGAIRVRIAGSGLGPRTVAIERT